MRQALINLGRLRWRCTRATVLALALGTAAVGLSFALRLSPSRLWFLLVRDVLQIALVGVLVPMWLLRQPGEVQAAGLRYDRPLRHLAIGCVLGGLLTLQFLAEAGWQWFPFQATHLRPALYVMLVNIYEVFFFVIFLRQRIEDALGILPAILLAAGFFSLHHAGFQPEFGKMFLVGLFMISIFRVAKHWLVLLPLWWVGGVVDVLFRAEDIGDIGSVGWDQIAIAAFCVVLILTRPGPLRASLSALRAPREDARLGQRDSRSQLA